MPRPPRPGAREELLAAARAEFSRRGLEGARVEDIARRAGISKGAFYLHFGTKDEAFRELALRFLGALDDHALRRGDAVDGPPRDAAQLAAQLAAQERAREAELLELFWRHRPLLSALAGATGPEGRPLALAFRRRLRDLLERRLAERQRAGGLRAGVPLPLLADLALGAHEALLRRMIEARRKPDLAEWARCLLLLLGAGEPPAPRRRRAPRPRRAPGD